MTRQFQSQRKMFHENTITKTDNQAAIISPAPLVTDAACVYSLHMTSVDGLFGRSHRLPRSKSTLRSPNNRDSGLHCFSATDPLEAQRTPWWIRVCGTLLSFFSLISFRDRAVGLPHAQRPFNIKLSRWQFSSICARISLAMDPRQETRRSAPRSRDHVQSLRPNSEPLEPSSPRVWDSLTCWGAVFILASI